MRLSLVSGCFLLALPLAALALGPARAQSSPAPIASEAVACGPAPALKVVTFNIRYDDGGLGSFFAKDGWKNLANPRRERVLTVLRSADADIVGVQEALAGQVDDLRAGLPAYSFVGVGRDDGVRAGEFEGILFRKERFQTVAQGGFWLSETPEQPGTTFPGAGSNRMVTWVRLLDTAVGRELFVADTHWDNVSASARQRSGALLRERLGALAAGAATVVLGDLNEGVGGAGAVALAGASDPTTALADAYRIANPVVSPDEATFHDFTGRTAGERIDFVFLGAAFQATSAAIVRTSVNGGWPSDHFPVTATVVWSGATVPCPG